MIIEPSGAERRDELIEFDRVLVKTWSVKINSDMELVADGGCPRRAKAIILGVLDTMKNSDIMPKKCSFCAAPCKNRKCARCKKVVYCSAACQKSAWKTHKAECKPASN